MKAGHVHLSVRDLEAALEWIERVFGLTPRYRDENMASLPFGPLSIILDRADEESLATIAFTSDDCDADYARAIERGAQGITEPTDQPWGPVRSAYLGGPGRLIFEIEQIRGGST